LQRALQERARQIWRRARHRHAHRHQRLQQRRIPGSQSRAQELV
jgi:hypothetical protein